jgi:hypothetical protein
MKIEFENIKDNPVNILRRAGYAFQRHEGQEMSFVRALARAGYPRFHMYASTKENQLTINIHLDQKKNTYGNETRHHGEYEEDGPLKTEAERIRNVIG